MTLLQFPSAVRELQDALEMMERKRNVLYDAGELVVDATTEEEQTKAIGILEKALIAAGDPE